MNKDNGGYHGDGDVLDMSSEKDTDYNHPHEFPKGQNSTNVTDRYGLAVRLLRVLDVVSLRDSIDTIVSSLQQKVCFSSAAIAVEQSAYVCLHRAT